MRRKITSALLTAGVLTGLLVSGATSASAASHWSGNYKSLKSCNTARIAHEDYGQPTTPCYSSYDRNGTKLWHFYWYY